MRRAVRTPTTMTDDPVTAMETALEEDVEHVLVEFPDLDGVARSKQVGADYFRRTWRDGFSMNMLLLAVSAMTDVPEGSGYGAELDFADGTVHPIPETFARLPWRPEAARVLCEFEFRGDPAGAYTRGVLERVLEEVDDDLELGIGSELEFRLYDRTEDGLQPATTHPHECVSRVAERLAGVTSTVDRWACALDVPTNLLHHEYGSGQVEVLFEHGDPLTTADRTFTFREVVKEAAVEHDMRATFMAKPATDAAGNGHHLHVSAVRDGENVFAGDDGRLSETGRSFVAGVLEHADALTALCCPTINSFKRFQPGTFSPFTRSWGYNNRTALLRVPESTPVRVENRLAGADANPYLVVGATLAAGFHGVREGLDPGDPVGGDAAGQRPSLGRSPEVALRALESDEVLTDALGEEFVRAYTAVKREELDRFYEHVTDWEQRYLEVV